jgi:hypothetical protein
MIDIIDTVKHVNDPLTNEPCAYRVTRVNSNLVSYVPLKPDNTDYQTIQEWVAQGNTIQEAD